MNAMTIEEFRERLVECVGQELNKLGDYKCWISPEEKNNITHRNLVIQRRGSDIAPAFYLDKPYEAYLQGKPLHQISQEMISVYKEIDISYWKECDFSDYKKLKDHLRLRLVSKENNDKFYKQGPYRQQTLGVETLYLEFDGTKEGTISAHVTYELAKSWKIPEQELFQTALENSQTQDRIFFSSLGDFINQFASEEPIIGGDSLFYILTNEKKEYGATVTSYPQALKQVREQLGDDFFIVPSSTHEVLIVPKKTAICPRDLRAVLREMNQNIKPEEILGSEVYEFRSSTNKIHKSVKEEKER